MSSASRAATLADFVIPPALEAAEPPERRGAARDGVRLMVVRPDRVSHRGFRDLPAALDPGDLVVMNLSSTLPSALDGRRDDGVAVLVHVSAPLDGGDWVVEVRRPDNRGTHGGMVSGDRLRLPGGVTLTLIDPYPDPRATVSRLWRALASPDVAVASYLMSHGRPIGYRHLGGTYPLADFQNVYASRPGSAEMASAGRPITAGVLVDLITAGITVAALVLHAGVSSPDVHEPPYPERFDVPEATARLVNSARRAGRRVVAVGTTVVRALEAVATAGGSVRAGWGWTDLVLGEHRPARVVTGLLTGLHLPESSHLRLLEAVAGPPLVRAAYAEALQERYLWHEFGDSMLFLP